MFQVFATGNQGVDPKTGKYITSGGAQITVPHEKYGQDDFVIENNTKDWVDRMSQQQAAWRAHGQPMAPTGVNIMGAYKEPAPRALPANSTTQTDTDSDDVAA
jgi:hypothetical protein